MHLIRKRVGLFFVGNIAGKGLHRPLRASSRTTAPCEFADCFKGFVHEDGCKPVDANDGDCTREVICRPIKVSVRLSVYCDSEELI